MCYLTRCALFGMLVPAGFFATTLAAVAQGDFQRLPPTRITIDEEVLSVFVDEPCNHFESATDRFTLGDFSNAAKHLRTVSAFLQLEAARATPEGRPALDASIRELRALAHALEKSQVQSVEVLEQAFSRAHYALAGHHCIRIAHRCCNPATFRDKKEIARAAADLKAAAHHLRRGALWLGNDLEKETQVALEKSRLAVDALIEQRNTSPSDVERAIHALHRSIEDLTGRKVMLAPPLAEDDRFGPSLFR